MAGKRGNNEGVLNLPVEDLIARLLSADIDERLLAAKSLIRKRDAAALPALLDYALNDDSPEVRGAAKQAIRSLAQQRPSAIQHLWNSPDERVHAIAEFRVQRLVRAP